MGKNIKMNIKRLILSTPFYFIKKVFRGNLDNFVGGLIFGAVFSLIVNIATVKVQEDLSRQRALESLEREMIYHSLNANNLFKEVNRVNSLPDKQIINEDFVMNVRFDTRVWDSSDVSRYMLEIDPNVGPSVEMYYTIYVFNANRILKENLDAYNKLFEPCRDLYSLTSGKPKQSVEYCNKTTRYFLEAQTTAAALITEGQKNYQSTFHPTRDRLNNPWLRVLLGDKSIEILK